MTKEQQNMSIKSALVRAILEQWRSYTWTVQGFGFIRTKLAKVGRIHVWDSSLAVSRVSTAHAHPWALRSTIISGELLNQRFTVVSDPALMNTGVIGPLAYSHSRIATGEGGGLIGEPRDVELIGASVESYTAGDTYSQRPEEVHRSIPQDGTVTLMERVEGEPLQETDVYWPRGTSWVSAEPKKLEDWRIETVISYALSRWSIP